MSLVLVALAVASRTGRYVYSKASSRSEWTVGQTVQTSSGLIQGHAASNVSKVSEYLGIPYANPPIGELRFQPPTPFNGIQNINATSFVSKAYLFYIALRY